LWPIKQKQMFQWGAADAPVVAAKEVAAAGDLSRCPTKGAMEKRGAT
jgi:hypothetical protein